MPEVRLRIAREFIEALSEIYSDRLLQEIHRTIERLVELPELGSCWVRPSLRDRYGDGLRKITIDSFVLVYRYDDGLLEVLALVYGPRIS